MAKCKICGKTIGSVSIKLDPCKEIPDIKRTVRFCGEHCASVFLGRIKAKYKRQAKSQIRKALEKADRKPTNDDLVAIYRTLTEREKHIMFLVAFEAAYFSSLKLKDFYTRLNELSGKNKDSKRQNENGKRRFLLEYLVYGNKKICNGWWEIKGDMLVNASGGRHSYEPSSEDIIVEAEGFDKLDYSYLIQEDSELGWLSPDGKFFGCDYRNHAAVAYKVFGMGEDELEEKGWIKIYLDYNQKKTYYCEKIETENQKIMLRKFGFEVE